MRVLTLIRQPMLNETTAHSCPRCTEGRLCYYHRKMALGIITPYHDHIVESVVMRRYPKRDVYIYRRQDDAG